MTVNQLKVKALELRKEVLCTIYGAKMGHTGSDMGVLDILTVLYYDVMNVSAENPDDPKRDRFVLSKGHCAESLYTILADKGYFPKEELSNFCGYDTHFIGHPNRHVRGVEVNTGSLGHGLPVSVGLAIGAKMNHETWRIYTVMGDGEQAEGSVWEAAMAAANYKLDNITAFVDRNRLQITGPTEQVMVLDPLDEKWRSFGWNVLSCDGNDPADIKNKIAVAKAFKGRPTVIICNTTKGKGISFMENIPAWHHKVPTEEQLQDAVAQLNEAIRGIEA